MLEWGRDGGRFGVLGEGEFVKVISDGWMWGYWERGSNWEWEGTEGGEGYWKRGVCWSGARDGGRWGDEKISVDRKFEERMLAALHMHYIQIHLTITSLFF